MSTSSWELEFDENLLTGNFHLTISHSASIKDVSIKLYNVHMLKTEVMRKKRFSDNDLKQRVTENTEKYTEQDIEQDTEDMVLLIKPLE